MFSRSARVGLLLLVFLIRDSNDASIFPFPQGKTADLRLDRTRTWTLDWVWLLLRIWDLGSLKPTVVLLCLRA